MGSLKVKRLSAEELEEGVLVVINGSQEHFVFDGNETLTRVQTMTIKEITKVEDLGGQLLIKLRSLNSGAIPEDVHQLVELGNPHIYYLVVDTSEADDEMPIEEELVDLEEVTDLEEPVKEEPIIIEAEEVKKKPSTKKDKEDKKVFLG